MRREAPMKGLANAPSQPKVLSTKPHVGGKRLKVRNLDEKQVSNDDLKVFDISFIIFCLETL